MRKTALFLMAILVAAVSCGKHEDIIFRYRLEQALWRARAADPGMTIDYLRGSERELDRKIAAYEGIIEDNPVPTEHIGAWDPAVVRNIRVMLMEARLRLAHFTFLGERFIEPGMYFRSAVDDPVLLATGTASLEWKFACELYRIDSGKLRPLSCERYFRDIVTSETFWNSELVIGDTFLNIPVVASRIYKDADRGRSYEETANLAESFYKKIIRVWPDSLIAEKARQQEIRLMIVREEWHRAVRMIDDMLAHPFSSALTPRLLLLKGSIMEVGLGQSERALALYSGLIRDYPETACALAGEIARARILARSGRIEQARRMLRAVEKNEQASEGIRGAAMLSRAMQLEAGNKWNESMIVLRRLRNAYPFTEAALQAPLVITRHYIDSGDSALAARALERSKHYYLSLMARRNTLFERGLIPEDYLIENYLLAGQAEAIVSILTEESSAWGWSRNAAAMLKSAHICATVLGDRRRSREILEKCLALFPNTRYARVASNSLEALDIR